MGMIRGVDLDQVARRALVMNMGDLGAQAEAMVADARREAERIVQEARAERDRLVTTAREKGFNAGHAEGFIAGEREGLQAARVAHAESIGGLCEAWGRALDAFEAERDGLLRAARSEVVLLAAEIATRVTRRAVELDAGVVVAQMEAVLGAVARPTRLLIRVNPLDLDLARDELGGLLARFELCRHADLAADASLPRGSCVATTGEGGRIDAGIASQLERLVAELLPESHGIRIGPALRGDAA